MLLDQSVFPEITDLELQLPIYMHATGHLSNQYPIDQPNGSKECQWIQCTSGEGILEVHGLKYTVSKDHGMFLYPDIPYKYYATQEPWEVYWMLLCGSHIEQTAKLCGMERSGVFRLTDSDILLNHIKNAYSIANSGKQLVGLECAKHSYNLLMDIIRCINKGQLIDQDINRLQPVIDYIGIHYNKVITLGDLADLLNVTTQHLCLLFRQLLNMRPIEYLNKVRIRKSKEFMNRNRDRNISEIAYMVGFENPGYFSRCFKRYEGVTPQQFRTINGI